MNIKIRATAILTKQLSHSDFQSQSEYRCLLYIFMFMALQYSPLALLLTILRIFFLHEILRATVSLILNSEL